MEPAAAPVFGAGGELPEALKDIAITYREVNGTDFRVIASKPGGAVSTCDAALRKPLDDEWLGTVAEAEASTQIRCIGREANYNPSLPA